MNPIKIKTYKDKLRSKWYWGSTILSIGLFLSLPIMIITKDGRWIIFCIVIIIAVRIVFPTKCPKCNSDIYIRPGTKAFISLNYCQKCGFHLNKPIEDDNNEKNLSK